MRRFLLTLLPVLVAGLALNSGGCGKKTNTEVNPDGSNVPPGVLPPPPGGGPGGPGGPGRGPGGPGGPGGFPGGPGGPGGNNKVEEAEPHLLGKKTFNSHCSNCHSVTAAAGPSVPPGIFPGNPNGPGAPSPGGPGPGGPPPGGRAPGLSKIGANPEHTVEWLSEFVRDPRSKNPRSRMAGFGEDKINAAALKALSEYLATLK